MSERARMHARRALVFVLLGSAIMIAVPYAIGFYIDGLTTAVLDALLVGGVLYSGLEINNIVLGWFRQQVRQRFFQEEFWFLPQSITRKYFLRPLSFLTGHDSEIDGGGVDSLREKVWNVIQSYIFQIIPNYATMLFGLLACFYANWLIGLLALAYTALEFWIGAKDNAWVQAHMRPVIDQMKRWERRMQEWWNNVDHIKHQGVETKILEQIHREIQPALREDDRIWRVEFAKMIVRHRSRGLLCALVLYAGLGYLVLGGMMSLASGVLVFFSFERIRTVMGETNDQQREVQFNLASVAKYRRVLSVDIPFTYDEGYPFPEEYISINFEDVSHSVYCNGTPRRILENVSLTINSGERVGVVGPSGAGKSQLMSLLVQASNPESGRILVSGHDLRKVCTESLLRYYGVIMQKSEPYEDTLLGNLLHSISHLDLPVPYEELSADEQAAIEERAHEALEKAGLELDEFSWGLRTNIGYKGMRLSGGQQQRLQIAAAHLKLSFSPDRPRFVLADEPTSSLDSLSETRVMAHLNDNLPAGTTVLMVAHRLSTVAGMDRILFVRPRSVCADNTPQVTAHSSLAELYDAEALFREMADAQGFRP